MPALSPYLLLDTLVNRGSTANSTISSSGDVSNVTGHGLQVVCAWPVSGQYGPGSRILYYVLIAACVIARKAEWIKNACLAAALLLPAVAAIHGIVLAAFHQEGAIDMDVYGAFQLCAIGILVAPATVRLSRTYFYDPGRNAIFLWAGIILAGLLSLTVEFYRAQTFTCTQDGHGKLVSSDPGKFPYGEETTCGLRCSVEAGPFSPMRGGAANNIYVIPVPQRLTFGTATLLSAACCVYAILWLASMLDKIMEINWRSRFGLRDDELRINEPIEGTNGATIKKMNRVNETIRFFMSVAAIPLFGGAGIVFLIIGEINFYSEPVRYQNEPMASIGQWAPVVGTGIASIGSLYLLLVADIQAVIKENNPDAGSQVCKCPHHHSHGPQTNQSPSSRGSGSMHRDTIELSRYESEDGTPRMRQVQTNGTLTSTVADDNSEGNGSPRRPGLSRLTRHITRESQGEGSTSGSQRGSRRRVARALIAVGNSLGSKAHDSFDVSKFRDGPALDFPEIPGEAVRNRDLAQIRKVYSLRQEPDGTPALRSRSRASSFIGSVASGQGIEGLGISREASPRPDVRISRSPSPLPSSSPGSRQRASTLPVGRRSHDRQAAGSASIDSLRGRERKRRDTLEVPPAVTFHLSSRTHPSPKPRPSSPPAPSSNTPPVVVSSPFTLTNSLTEEPGAMSPDLSGNGTEQTATKHSHA